MRRRALMIALSLGLLTGCSWGGGSDAPIPAPTMAADSSERQMQLRQDLAMLQETDWSTQPIFDVTRSSPSEEFTTIADQQARSETVKVLGVRVSEQFLQARALVIYTTTRSPGQWVGVGIFQAENGKITQVGTGLVGQSENDLNIDELIFEPTVMGVDIYLRAAGDPVPGYWVWHQQMSTRTYAYLPEYMSWVGLSLEPAGSDLAAGEHLGQDKRPAEGVIVVGADQLTGAGPA